MPKRAILEVYLHDIPSNKSVLVYEGKLKASPNNLDIRPDLVGNSLTVNVSDRMTHESWVIEFHRRLDGQFQVIREQGSFRDFYRLAH